MSKPTSTTPIDPVLASDGSYEVVVLDKSNRVQRCIFRSVHYLDALLYLQRNLRRRPWLDMVRDGRFVEWEFIAGCPAGHTAELAEATA